MEGVLNSTADLNISATENNKTQKDTEDITQLYYALIPNVVLPVILACGTLGNVMTIVVMRGMKAGRSSASIPVYFTALAISDLLILYTGLLPDSVYYVFHINVRNSHAILCKAHWFLLFYCSMTSAWLLVAMTCQRAVAVLSPHRVGLCSSSKTGKVTVLAIVLVACLFNAHVPFTYDLVTKDNATTCAAADNPQIQYFSHIIHPWIDNIFAATLPSCILVMCNGLLIRGVNASVNFAEGSASSAATATRKRKAASLTVTLVLTSVAFVLLTLPATVSWLLLELLQRNEDYDELFMAKLTLSQTVCEHVWYCNSAVNFYLYCLTGTKFRNEVKRLFGRK